MAYKLIGKRGEIPFDLTFCENSLGEDFYMKEYARDESGTIRGVRCAADLGHGYGFDHGTREFVLHEGEEYVFLHRFTTINGPSDWSEDSYRVTVRLVRAD